MQSIPPTGSPLHAAIHAPYPCSDQSLAAASAAKLDRTPTKLDRALIAGSHSNNPRTDLGLPSDHNPQRALLRIRPCSSALLPPSPNVLERCAASRIQKARSGCSCGRSRCGCVACRRGQALRGRGEGRAAGRGLERGCRRALLSLLVLELEGS
eukprot:990427-Rhodomonas_salina.1